jgi:predicted ATPase
MTALTGGAFVGRQREMGELKTALEDALSGQGRLVMLAGEPGIGKTRMAQEVAAYAEQRGVRALWGRLPFNSGCPLILALAPSPPLPYARSQGAKIVR